MAAHQHLWQEITLTDGSLGKVCLCGSFRVQFQAELPQPIDPWSQASLGLLEAEGTAELPEESSHGH
jgi:hypothetical protein